MGPIGARELVIILVVAMILFGSKRLPQAARSLGQSMRILKAETKGLRDDDTATTADHHVAPPVIPPAPQAAQAQAAQAQAPQPPAAEQPGDASR